MNPAQPSKMLAMVQTLHHSAWHGLRNSQFIPPLLIDSKKHRFGRPRIVLWHAPEGLSEDEPRSLTIYQPFDDVTPLVRKALWKQSIDTRQLREAAEGDQQPQNWDFRPTFEVLDRSIDNFPLEALLAEAAGWRIPVVWPWNKERDALTTDAGMVGFEYFGLPQPQASVRCTWSIDLPPEWEPIRIWFARLWNWLDDHFHEQSA